MLDNSGELNTNQKRELRAHLQGFVKGYNKGSGYGESCGRSSVYEEAMDYVKNNDEFQNRAFGQVLDFIDIAVDAAFDKKGK